MNYYAASQLHNSTTIRNPQIYFVNRYFLMFGGFQIRASYPASRNDVRVLKPWYQKRVHKRIHPRWCTPSWTLFTLICIAMKLCSCSDMKRISRRATGVLSICNTKKETPQGISRNIHIRSHSYVGIIQIRYKGRS